MDVQRILLVSEGVLTALIAGTWYRVLRRGNIYVSWRNKASIAALILVSIAAVVQLGLSAVTQLRSLEAVDAASLKGGWNSLLAHLWLWSFVAAGLLSCGGLVLAIGGKGSPRLIAGVWSSVAFAIFLVNLVLAVNSFH